MYMYIIFIFIYSLCVFSLSFSFCLAVFMANLNLAWICSVGDYKALTGYPMLLYICISICIYVYTHVCM